MRSKCAAAAALILGTFALSLVGAGGPAFAYGNGAQWQVTFSATCHGGVPCPQSASPVGPVTGIAGVWGWCDLGGSDNGTTVGTVGTEGDCQATLSFGPQSATHFSYDITGWVIDTGSTLLAANGAPPSDPSFFVTSGTVEFLGNAAFFGLPTGVPIALSTLGCVPYTVTPGTGSPLAGDPFCDLGYPSVPGHYSAHIPGENANVQVTHIP